MRTPEEILRKPLLTEKVLAMEERQNKYGFVVLPDANKSEIKNAVEKKFDVEVKSVHIINVKGKRKRMNTRRGMTFGRRRNWKKAIVTLREGDKIDYFAGATS